MRQYASFDNETSDEFDGYADATPFDTEEAAMDQYDLEGDAEMAMDFDGDMPENDLDGGFDDFSGADDMAYDSSADDLSTYDLA